MYRAQRTQTLSLGHLAVLLCSWLSGCGRLWVEVLPQSLADSDAGAGPCKASEYFLDEDGDGYGDANEALSSCSAPAGYVDDGTDCDDAEASVHPTVPEMCDQIDNDCDGMVDEAGICAPCVPTSTIDDTCNDVDDDCNGQLDEDYVTTATSCGVGPCAAVGTTQCSNGAVTDGCRAGRPQNEFCDGIDNDCDGTIDDGVEPTFYRDVDGDLYGDPSVIVSACTAPDGFVAVSTDCDDELAFVHPKATELCDSVDNDCDGSRDEGACPADGSGFVANKTPYMRLSQGRDWSASARVCTNAGMRLATVETQAEQDLLWSRSVNTDTWIGGTDVVAEGVWRWNTGVQFWAGKTNGTTVGGQFTNWMPGVEPQDTAGVEDCTVMHAGHGGRWADDPCNIYRAAFCEGPTR